MKLVSILSILIFTSQAFGSEFFYKPEAKKLTLDFNYNYFSSTSKDVDIDPFSTIISNDQDFSFNDNLITAKVSYGLTDITSLSLQLGYGFAKSEEDYKDLSTSDEESRYEGLDSVVLNARTVYPTGPGELLIDATLFQNFGDFSCEESSTNSIKEKCDRNFGNTILNLGLGYQMNSGSNTYGALINYSPVTTKLKFKNSPDGKAESDFKASLFYEKDQSEVFTWGVKYTYLEASFIPNLTKGFNLKGGEKFKYHSLTPYLKYSISQKTHLLGSFEYAHRMDTNDGFTKYTNGNFISLNLGLRQNF